jgi:hypothetical protein
MIINADSETARDEFHRASQGIRNPKVVTLPAGEVLFRFSSTSNVKTGDTIPSSEWARAPWWFLEEDYRRIIERHQASALGLGTIARAAGAVLPSWSLMDVSIKVRLRFDTKVYTGRGRTPDREALPNGMYIRLPGWPDVQQIYIPNLRGQAFATLEVVRQKRVTSDRFGY